MPVTILFARNDSIYKTLNGDVWDKARDARTFTGSDPVVAHPPCRAWGGLSHLAKPEPGEKDLARLAVDIIRKNGGVLEHPVASKLWGDKGLPNPGCCDEYGGFTLKVQQLWWGHKAIKMTKLYIVGCQEKDIPMIPFKMDYATHVVTTSKRKGEIGWKKRLSKKENEQTPIDFAIWLIELAEICAHHNDK